MWENFDTQRIIMLIIPCLILEFPVYFATIVAAISRFKREAEIPEVINDKGIRMLPGITVGLIAYREEWDIQRGIVSAWQQSYQGPVEILVIVEGGAVTRKTYQIAKSTQTQLRAKGWKYPRTIHILQKESRTGRVASLNYARSASNHNYLLIVDGDSYCHINMVLELMRELTKPDVIAATGSIDAANPTTVVEKFQALEYRACLSGMKYGLAEMGILNNISGAFGGFDTRWLNQLGGWDNGTAEDLDLTIRLKCLAHQRGKRLGFAVNSVLYTGVPPTCWSLIDQRIRWDGDLLYVYFMKNFSLIRPRNMGWRSFIGIVISGYLHQIFLPFVIVAYLIYATMVYGEPIELALIIFIYALYALFFTIIYLVSLFVRKSDPGGRISDFYYVPFYPFYALTIRIVSFFAYLNEWITKGHEKSSMAPWKVLKTAYEKLRE